MTVIDTFIFRTRLGTAVLSYYSANFSLQTKMDSTLQLLILILLLTTMITSITTRSKSESAKFYETKVILYLPFFNSFNSFSFFTETRPRPPRRKAAHPRPGLHHLLTLLITPIDHPLHQWPQRSKRTKRRLPGGHLWIPSRGRKEKEQ